MATRLTDRQRQAIGAAAVISGTAMSIAVARRRRAGHYSFRNRAVVITGGARGFGLALARALAAERPHLFLISRTETELVDAKIDLEVRGAKVETIVCDIRRRDEVERAIERVVERAGRVDVLINNAGVIQAMPFEHTQLEDFEASLDTHFRGPLYLVRAALPHMPRGSRIVNISSIGGRVAVPHLLPYCVGKFALAALSDGLRAELAKDGIYVTTVAPWLMTTGSHRNVLVRGKHNREAQWFALGTATAAMNADRAARIAVEACRQARARVSPGWPANLAIVANALASELVSDAMAATVRWVLPAPASSSASDEPRYSRDLDLGWLSKIFPTRAARNLNQPSAVGETR